MAACYVTLIFSRAPARMSLLKNPPVYRLRTYSFVIIYLIGTFSYGCNDRSPYGVGRQSPKSKRWGPPIFLLPRSHTLCQDTCCTTHKVPLAISAYMRYHTRVRVCGHVPIRGYVPLGLAVSHAGGLSCMPRCSRLGVGVSAVLGPLEARFGHAPAQTSSSGTVNSKH